MKINKTSFEDVLIIEPKVFSDERGWFSETYSKVKFEELGIDVEFVQDNHSFSKNKGTIRGLHFQIEPKAQTKLVRCTKGEILDIAVDIRKKSPTYKKWISVKLTEKNMKMLLIPKGFAHGFVTLTNNVEVEYKVDQFYSPTEDRSFSYDDPEVDIDWGVNNPILSKKDLNAPNLSNIDFQFEY